MNILIVPDSFKGSLSATQVSEAISDGVKKILPDSVVKKIPFSDGGEGAIDFLNYIGSGKSENIFTENSIGSKIQVPIYWIKKNKIAWIELSQASGLSTLNDSDKNPLVTSTFGTGILINHALNKGCEKIYVGLGGSSTHDLGSGVFMALGGKLLNKDYLPILRGGQGLSDCEKIIFNNLNYKIQNCEIILAVDVNNKLLGITGAAKTYSRQKGANHKTIQKLENGSKKFAKLIEQTTGRNILKIKGGGAAGGTAAGLYGLINAKINSGFDILSDLFDLESYIANADLIISGEGHLDHQSCFDKLIGKVGVLAKKNGKPLICIAGKVSLNSKEYKNIGITKAWPTKPVNYTLKKAMEEAYDLVSVSAEKAMKSYIN